MTSRDRLRAELALAEAALVKAVVWTHPGLSEDDPAVASARAACRRIKTEFNRLENLVDQSMPPGRIDLLLKELRSLKVDELVARAPPIAQLLAATPPVPRHRVSRGLWLKAVHRRTVRHSLGLLSLVLAFLAYYHIDVQLQILTLPSSGLERWHKRASLGSDVLLVSKEAVQPANELRLRGVELLAGGVQIEPLAAVHLGKANHVS